MQIINTSLQGVMLIKPTLYGDDRGFFMETYQSARYADAGLPTNFVQDNHSKSQRNVLRGLHFQKRRPQGKLVRCISGSVYDVAVDIDPKSKSFGKYCAVELTADNHLQLWIPAGYAHGFCVLSEEAEIEYKCTDYYDPNDESGVIWNDCDIAIDWPIKNPILSVKDAELPSLRQITSSGNAND